jgi:predicted nuclease of predicted toxin-antitoxin system
LAIAVRDLGFRNAKDQEIFSAARKANAVVMTKDADFVHLVEKSGSPSQAILLACGNTSNSELKQSAVGSPAASDYQAHRRTGSEKIPL